GNDLNVAAKRNLFKPLGCCHLLSKAFDSTSYVRPERLLVAARNEPDQSNAPSLDIIACEPQALERDRKQHNVSIRGQPSLGMPKRVEVEIIVLTLGGYPVRLYSKRVYEKLICPATVVECVKQNSDYIIVEDVLALAHMRAHLTRFVFALDDHVQVLVVIGKITGSRLADWIAVVRLALAKVGNFGLGFPWGVVEKVFELWRP